jgi:hypothetical protein
MPTDSLGRFSVPGLDRGTLIVQIRKIGYARYFNSLRMLAERADTIYMARLPETLTPVQVNELGGYGSDYWAHRDLQQRQSWKGAMAGAISREELAQHGKENLCDALPGTASGARLSLHNDPNCKSFPEGVRTILVDGVRCEHSLLSDFAADEVELVEYIPPGRNSPPLMPTLGARKPKRGDKAAADLSGSLAGHNCSYPAPVYVIWTRKSPDIHILAAAADSALARDTTRSIAGTVFDSIAQRPLAGARVHLADLNRDTVTDSVGVFRFDSVGAGVHGVWVDHPVLDTLGLYSLGERVDATVQRVSTAAIAIPSFGTLWTLACGTATVPHDGEGFVFGQVHADDPALIGSSTLVDLRWRVSAEDSAGAAGKAVQRSVRPDSAGNYAICGVPDGRVVTLSVHDSSVTAIPVSFRTSERRIVARSDAAVRTRVRTTPRRFVSGTAGAGRRRRIALRYGSRFNGTRGSRCARCRVGCRRRVARRFKREVCCPWRSGRRARGHRQLARLRARAPSDGRLAGRLRVARSRADASHDETGHCDNRGAAEV